MKRATIFLAPLDEWNPPITACITEQETLGDHRWKLYTYASSEMFQL